MRELVIKFSTEGERFREIDESKSYFFSEAEKAINLLEKRLKNEGREAEKRFGFYMDGEYLLDSIIAINKNKKADQIEEHIVKAFTSTDQWTKEVAEEQVRKLKNYVQNEREAFLNEEFRAFAYLIRDVFEKKVDFLFSLKQTQALFQEVYAKIANGFFSQLEDIVFSILDSYECVVDFNDLLKGTYEETQLNKEKWFSNEHHFSQFVRFVSANYFSISHARLDVLMSNNQLYQSFQDYLFEVKAENDFFKSWDTNLNLKKEFERKWIELQFEGLTINEEFVETGIIESILVGFFREELKKGDLTEEERRFCEGAARIEKRF
ncbi:MULTISPECIES: hypothetical protein [Bacillus]|uniref:hypothetical protein n=1 Tax=Bacillus TaxID=1386 RepID=UPI000BF70F52|nr:MULTISPECIES: hypothetical protein [Bacillus]MBA1163601.1 hypothetical protein [Bacillus licheniformis]